MRTAAGMLALALVAVMAAGTVTTAQGPTGGSMDDIAEQYVRLVLAVGQHDPDYVDAFYGPAEWKTTTVKRPIGDLLTEVRRLIAQVPPPSLAGQPDPLLPLRHDYLRRQLQAVEARLRMLQGEKLPFDAESQALYDAVAPVHTAADYDATLRELEPLLPGDGTLIERYERFRRAFIIPTDRLARVFSRAIEECRSRTLRHIALPAEESFRVEYVTNKAWSGYNWYQGRFHSLIQVNTDLPIYIDRAVDLACHEGYPGHHVYNVRLEQALVRERGWFEYTVYPLFSPQSLIAEGTANYGIEVTFSQAERLAFERDVLFPLAGLDPARVQEYYRVQALVERLAYAGNEAARGYLDGAMTREQAAAWLTRYALMSPPRAEQRTRFFEQYRSYVINYNLGKDLVKRYIEAQAGAAADRRWTVFSDLISSPRLPSGLQPAAAR